MWDYNHASSLEMITKMREGVNDKKTMQINYNPQNTYKGTPC